MYDCPKLLSFIAAMGLTVFVSLYPTSTYLTVFVDFIYLTCQEEHGSLGIGAMVWALEHQVVQMTRSVLSFGENVYS